MGPTYVSVLSALTVATWYTTNRPFKGHLFWFSTAAKLVGGMFFSSLRWRVLALFCPSVICFLLDEQL